MKESEKELKRRRMHFGLVFQDFNLFPQYSVLKNLTLAPSLMKMGTSEELENNAKRIIERVGLSDKIDFYPCQLSGGQKQRVAIARALTLNQAIQNVKTTKSNPLPKNVAKRREDHLRRHNLLSHLRNLGRRGWNNDGECRMDEHFYLPGL